MLIDFKKAVWCGALLCGMVVAFMPVLGAAEQADAPRKITRKVLPVYPELARQWHLAATVKLVATVTPEGAVKSVRTLGGHPVFVNAAERAVLQWKYEPSKKETAEAVSLAFVEVQ